MKQKKEERILTIAAIRKPKRGGVTEYLFNESQQIFTLKTKTKSSAEFKRNLEKAFRRKEPLKVAVDSRTAIIQKIVAPSSREIAKFHEQRILLDKPEKPLRVKIEKIDPAVFNIVDLKKFPVFRFCKRVIPSYTIAKKIFDFCAKQSCHLPGPKNISPCIPFQYVRDGCYARAHKMRWIITKRYRYCCEKVFSFANKGNDRLAVQANKWGGCCVTWWYHVAPLVRVRFRFGRFSIVLALVIDPGMFDKPVLLSSWLNAQKTLICSANANVSMYSIQPGSAYSPANYAGTAFTTDPSYTSTNATLIAYRNLVTC